MTADPRDLYLDLLKNVLTGLQFSEEVISPRPSSYAKKLVLAVLETAAAKGNLELVRRIPIDRAVREEGRDYPESAETMVGLRRLENIQEAVRTVVDEDIPGDWLETGVWRGGASIFARACFEAYGDEGRTVWLADSFRGLPKPSMPQDEGDLLWSYTRLAVDVDTVRANFARYGFLDDRVEFLVGWFAETLPDAQIDRLAILRLDGDLYESTMDALQVYDKVSPGGFVIVDDYNAIPACKEAITVFRRDRSIGSQLVSIDDHAVYWRK